MLKPEKRISKKPQQQPEQNSTEVPDDGHNKALYDSLSNSAQQFDKQCLYIASGAFGLSFAFITDIVPDLGAAISKELLFASWATLTGVIFIGLVGHFVSTLVHLYAVKNAQSEAHEFNQKIKRGNYLINGLNIISILGLLIGCILLIAFVSKNLNANTMSKQQNTTVPAGPTPGSPGTLGAPVPPRVTTPQPPKK